MNIDNELYHYGIKGMKWGIRRFQKKDGTLTPAGKKRYSEEVTQAKDQMKKTRSTLRKANVKYDNIPSDKNFYELQQAKSDYDKAKLHYKVKKAEADGLFDTELNKSKHQMSLEEKYKKQGYDDKEAFVMARDRIRTERIIAGAAAVTITACAAYAANKYVKNRTDQIIKSGSVFQRIETNDSGQLHSMFYASIGKHDNKRYEGLLGSTRQSQSGKAFLMKLENKGDLKVASREKAASVFEELYKNDSDFRQAVEKHVFSNVHGGNIAKTDKLNKRNIRKMYDNFNSSLMSVRAEGSGADKKFYDSLKKSGYSAIQDINDMKFSGYKAKNPLIIFDNSKAGIMSKTVTELNKDDTLKKSLVEYGKMSVESMGELLTSPVTSAALAGTATTMYVSDNIDTKKG